MRGKIGGGKGVRYSIHTSQNTKSALKTIKSVTISSLGCPELPSKSTTIILLAASSLLQLVLARNKFYANILRLFCLLLRIKTCKERDKAVTLKIFLIRMFFIHMPGCSRLNAMNIRLSARATLSRRCVPREKSARSLRKCASTKNMRALFSL